MPRHHFYPQPLRELLCLGYITRGHDQNDFCLIRVIVSVRALRLQVSKMLKDVGEMSPSPRVVRVPRLCDMGVGSPKLPNERGDPNAICNHGEKVPWVTPSLICKNWPDLSLVSRTTSVAQWR